MWKSQNKVRPGVYVNVKGSKALAMEVGTRGTVILPLVLSFGPVKKFVSITDVTQTFSKLGYNYNTSEMLLIKEAMKKALEVLVYRVNSNGMKASAQVASGLKAEAVYPGDRGNDLSLTVEAAGDRFKVETYLDAVLVDTQIISTATEFINNGFVSFTGSGTLEAASVNLTGGTDGAAEEADYKECLQAAALVEFETIGYTGTDDKIIKLIKDFVEEQREYEEKNITGVVAAAANTFDYEGIIAVRNGVILADGTELPKEKAVAWVAAATAGAQISESNTFAVYEGASDVDVRLTNAQVEEAINAGLFVFTPRSGKVVAEYDINTLTTYTDEKPKDFRKNKVIRVLDAINNDVVSIFEANFIGKIQNNESGRNLLKGHLTEYMNSMQEMGAIENFVPDDITISRGTDKDAVLITLGVQPTDTVDKIYMNVEVK